MYLKIIWENGSESLVECSRVRVAPTLDPGSEGIAIMFEAIDHAHRPQGLYYVSPEAKVHVFVMNDAGDTIENWHHERRSALAKLLDGDRFPKPDLTTAKAGV